MITNNNSRIALIILAASIGLVAGARAALTTIVQTGAPAGADEHYVAVLLRDSDGGLPAGGYTLFKSDSVPANFSAVASGSRQYSNSMTGSGCLNAICPSQFAAT